LKGFGLLFFIALGIVYSPPSHALTSCENLFARQNSLPQKLIQRIDNKTSLEYEKYYAFVSLDAPISKEARESAYELLRISRYLGAYQADLASQNERLSESEALKLGDIIYAQAKTFLDRTNIKYKTRRIEIYGTTKNAFVILPEGSHPLNIEAKSFQRNSQTELEYTPYELLASGSEALFYPTQNKISISSTMLVEGSVKKNEAGKHELTHLMTKIYYDTGVPYLFHGSASTHGILPGGKGPYAKDFFFDEMDAFLTQTYANIDDLATIKYKDPRYTIQGQLQLAGIYRSSLETSLQFGNSVSNQSYNLFTEALKNLRENSDSIDFVKKGNYYHASWTTKKASAENNYLMEVPLLVDQERATRAELLVQLENHLEKQQYAAMYYRNVFKVGFNLFKKIQEEGHTDFTATFKKYQKLIERKYNFKSYNDVPTQKELENSLDFSF
jgi:hypothetical protein